MFDVGLFLFASILAAGISSLLAYRPHYTLYALAAVISLVGINIHVGVTFYLSRIVIILFLLSVLIRLAVGRDVKLPSNVLYPFAGLFGVILLFQLVSVLRSDQMVNELISVFYPDRLSAGMTQIFIYISMMTIFMVVIMVSGSVKTIIRAIWIYLSVGLLQGLYGLYQLIGYKHGWPTYETLMAGIPLANDHTNGGYMWSGTFHTFRATGFFPADVGFYAAYMSGVVLLGLTLIVFRRRVFWPYLFVLFGGMGVVFSLSRSGLLSLCLFGFPSLIFLLSKVSRVAKRRSQIFVTGVLMMVVPVGVLAFSLAHDFDVKLPNVVTLIPERMADLVNPGEYPGDSMEEHIMTRLTGLDALASSPLLGVGLGENATPWYSEYYHRGWGGSHSHHLDILGETGFVGSAPQFLFMALVCMYMWRGLFVTREPSLERHLLAGLLSTYITILLGNFFYHYFVLDFVWFLMGLGIALSRLLILDAKKKAALFATLESQGGDQCLMRGSDALSEKQSVTGHVGQATSP